MARIRATLAAVTVIGLAMGASVTLATAQTAPTPEAAKKAPAAKKKKSAPADDAKDAAKKPDPAAAQKQIEAAQKALDAGKADVAVNQINAVMAQAGLDARSLARALVVRGQAYRKQSKPAQAIADLQSAVQLKNGLSDAERSAASQAMADAYKEAGLNPPQSGGPVRATGPQSAPLQTASTAREPDAKPAAPASGGNFFSSLFGGGASPQPQAAPKPAPTAPAPVAAAPEPPTAPRVNVARAPTPAAPPPPAKSVQPASAPAAVAATGRYRLQLGPVRSRDEAQKVADRMKREQGAVITGRSLDIAEQVFGNMGTFYVVRVGPFADAAQSKEACDNVRAKVADCQVQLVGQ